MKWWLADELANWWSADELASWWLADESGGSVGAGWSVGGLEWSSRPPLLIL